MILYNKLVRDKIPEIIEKDNCISYIRTLDSKEYLEELNKKLSEELNEYLQSGDIEELADLVEVVLGIIDCKNVSVSDFEKIRESKVLKRGAFKKRIFLEKTEQK